MAVFLGGCSYLGVKSPFGADPLTGGVDAGTSTLLDVALPAGLQRYSGHGFVGTSANGGKEGLETLRSASSARTIALALFNTLKSHNWQMRMFQRKGERAFYLYQKDGEYAALVFHPQGALTILEIWRGPALPDGAVLTFAPEFGPSDDGEASIAPEEYGPMEKEQPLGAEERWGGTLEEKEL